MKKFLIISNLFTLSLWLYTSYKYSNLASIQGKNCDWFCYNYSNKPIEEIPYQAMNTVMDNYRDRWGNKFEKKDTRWVWFPLEKLKHFIYLVEKTSCKECLAETKTTLGVRFYFIEYPDKAQLTRMDTPSQNYFNHLSSVYYRKHNLLLVPTFQKGNKTHVDFDIKSTQSKCVYMPMSEVMANYRNEKSLEKATFSMFSAAPGDASNPFAMNRGGMGPPPYNDGDELMQSTDNY
ncbi:hypothetical protein [Runella sp. SP2]|uniref:hypothetical protein n=1 Tax=Runella sp. SP2 TaxID=2268026 RepID=UPI000F082160|nr:hypothetical protein [Runella sp. SP2]AYQ31885.1 hypothetical protein DTQ70_06715 [Runella sp. SP2]